PGWLLSPPGRPYLDSILHRDRRRVFAPWEAEDMHPSFHRWVGNSHLFGGSLGRFSRGLGGSLGGVSAPVPPGIEVSTVYWPAKPRASARPVLFQLHFWD
ncbi:CPLN2 protein, partial [Serilophus lunatus]|nr:CPLN2 protein [Serilophus lunatus]